MNFVTLQGFTLSTSHPIQCFGASLKWVLLFEIAYTEHSALKMLFLSNAQWDPGYLNSGCVTGNMKRGGGKLGDIFYIRNQHSTEVMDLILAKR